MFFVMIKKYHFYNYLILGHPLWTKYKLNVGWVENTPQIQDITSFFTLEEIFK